ncbi:MAG: hypothetical protein IJT94_02280 [Oscillibacter sp.]|nr:hypothetical protein [Oscillibacter sp.]
MKFWEEVRTEIRKMRKMRLSEALDYFWTYYKIHILAVGIAVFFLPLIFQAAFGGGAEPYLSVLLVNLDIPQEYADRTAEDFAVSLGLDRKASPVLLDTSAVWGRDVSAEDTIGLQKMILTLAAGEADLVLTDPDTAAYLADAGAVLDVRQVPNLSQIFNLRQVSGLSEQNQERFFYHAPAVQNTETASAADSGMDNKADSKMDSGTDSGTDRETEPVPVGVWVTEAYALAFRVPEPEGGVAACFPVTARHGDTAAACLEYMETVGRRAREKEGEP